MKSAALGRFLGWFSIGLGVAELVMPDRFRVGLGLPVRRGVVRGAYGAREIAAGVALLARKGRAPAWLWTRVGGDVVDALTLGTAMVRGKRPQRARAAAALGSVLAVTGLDVFAGTRQSAEASRRGRTPARWLGVHPAGRVWFPQGSRELARA